MLCIIGNPKTGQGYTVKFVSPEYIAAAIASGSEFFVAYDPFNASHVAFRPGDLHDGKGNFRAPVLTPELVQEAKAIVMDPTSGITDTAVALAACDSAKTIDELPVMVAGLRNWTPSEEELEKGSVQGLEAGLQALHGGPT